MYIIDLKNRTVAEFSKGEVSGFAIYQEKNKKNKDGSISQYMKIDISFLKYQAHYNNQKVEIREVA